MAMRPYTCKMQKRIMNARTWYQVFKPTQPVNESLTVR